MPPKTRLRSAKGNAITRNPARIDFAVEQLRTKRYNAARKACVEHWGIHPTTAERDLAYAKRLIATEMDSMAVRAAEVVRNERIADSAEELAEKAAEASDWTAAATLQRTAIAASREVSRLTGAYAPARVQVTHTGGMAPERALELDAIIAILDDQGRAAMRLVLEQIEAAKADGRLAPPADDDVEDAEIVGDHALPAGGEPGTGSGEAN